MLAQSLTLGGAMTVVTVAAAVVAGSCYEVDCRAEPGNLVV